jgi:hypothetical protein
VTDDHLKGLAALKRLQVLSLTETKVTDAGLKELAQLGGLEELSIRAAPVTGAGLKHLAALKQLRSLTRGGLKITDASPPQYLWFGREHSGSERNPMGCDRTPNVSTENSPTLRARAPNGLTRGSRTRV